MKKLIFLLTVLLTVAPIFSEKRIALVIGNGSYSSSPLNNAVTDAIDMAKTLGEIGFNVNLVTDGTRRDILSAINDFGDSLDNQSVGLFYYAGHGVQVEGENFLIPVRAEISRESDIEFEGVSLDRVVRTMEDSKTYKSLIFLDACRDNPYSSTSRSGTRGLSVVAAKPDPKSAGTLIAFATSPGDVAKDGDGRNGTFTGALLKYIKQPGLEIQQVMTKVRAEVLNETNGKQIPWTNISLTEEFYFREGSTIAMGSLELSVYDKASIYIDGVYYQDVERDSITVLASMDAGRHLLEFRYPNYSDKRSVLIGQDEVVSVSSTYEENPVFNLIAESTQLEGAEVVIDGESIGTVPFNSYVPVGLHNITLVHPTIYNKNFKVNPGTREVLNLDLSDIEYKMGSIEIQNLPDDSKIEIIGKNGSNTYISSGVRYIIPDKFVVGDYRINIKNNYITPISMTFSVNEGDDNSLKPVIESFSEYSFYNDNLNDVIVDISSEKESVSSFSVLSRASNSVDIKPGEYTVSYRFKDDVEAGLREKLVIKPFTSVEKEIKSLEYSVAYQINRKIQYRDSLEIKYSKAQVSRSANLKLGLALIFGGIGSIAYGGYSYMQMNDAYTNYSNAVYTTDAIKYRKEAEDFRVSVNVTALAGGISLLIGSLINGNLPNPDKIRTDIDEVELEIFKLEHQK